MQDKLPPNDAVHALIAQLEEVTSADSIVVLWLRKNAETGGYDVGFETKVSTPATPNDYRIGQSLAVSQFNALATALHAAATRCEEHARAVRSNDFLPSQLKDSTPPKDRS